MVVVLLLAPTPKELTDLVVVKAMSSPSPYVVLVDRWKPMVNAPAVAPPWFFTVLESERELPGLMAVVVVDSAVITRSGLVTLIVDVVHLVLFVSLLSVTAVPLSAMAQM